jgi:maltooligosyltrehalose trehalohydrolase
VWAPRRRSVEVEVFSDNGAGPARSALEPEDDGYFSAALTGISAGQRYGFRLDGDARLLPDPASRFQPDGPAGPSQVVDPARFAWSDVGWTGVGAAGLVVYEMHVGTLTHEGTFRAAREELPRLADLGITLIEVLPVAEFPGRFGWGYDGVLLWAPSHLYGVPDDFRAFVDRAHAVGIGVILDVVYNHFGPACNCMGEFSPDYFTERYSCDWGAALNFDGPNAGPVREFFTANAAYWIEEFHLDGLRFDATQALNDESEEHILRALTRSAREAAAGRSIFLVGENEPQHAQLAEPLERGGSGLDALWNDDFHHSARAAVTGRHEAYYSDYRGTPQELISAVRHGFLYQGQHYPWQKQPRGTPALHLPATSFVTYLQNHDQVANSFDGARLHKLTSPGRLRAITALLLLAPGTPMLFQGQEFGSERPFLFFADHAQEIQGSVRDGRAEFLKQFASLCSDDVRARLTDPADGETFERCRLDTKAESERAPGIVALHRDLLALRRSDPAFRQQRADRVDGAVLASEALALRFFAPESSDRLLIVNLGRDLDLTRAPEPLLAPPLGCRWSVRWSSESPEYGGLGMRAFDPTDWWVTGHSALVLEPVVLGSNGAS